MPSNDRIHRLDIVRHCCRPPGPVSRIRAAATTALHNRPINRQTWCFLSTITIGAYYEDDDHDDGDLRVSRASAVVQWQRGNRCICYRILNVPIRWVLYLFWRFFVSGISPPVRMTNNAYVIYRSSVYVFYSRSIARSFGVSCLPTTPTVQLLARCPESSCSKSWRAFLNRCVVPSIPFSSRFDVSMDDDYWRIRRTRLNTIIYEIPFQRIQLPYNASY